MVRDALLVIVIVAVGAGCGPANKVVPADAAAGPAPDGGASDASPADAAPDPPDAEPALLPIGGLCTFDEDCAGGFCMASIGGAFFPDGYCVKPECDLAAPATSCLPYGGDGVCVDVDPTTLTASICFDACDPAAPDCRAGYACAFRFGANICFPEASPGGGPGAVGAPCAFVTDCVGNLCLGEVETGFPMGYCSETGCEPGAAVGCAHAGGDGICVDDGTGDGICVDQCAAPGDCRDGYSCVPLGPTGVCLPSS